MDLILKAAIGAAVVLILAALSKTRNYYIAGLVPLFPTFALIAHAIVGRERTMADLRLTAVFGLCSLGPYAVYLAAVALLAERLPLAATLVSATVAWAAAAGMLLLAWGRWGPH